MRITKILGIAVEVNDPYAKGHKCTVAEAEVLNQARATNIGNNLRESIREAVVKHTPELAEGETLATEQVVAIRAAAKDEIQVAATEYDAKYDFGMVIPRTKQDPVTAIARTLARDYLKEWASANGVKLSDYERPVINAEVARIADTSEYVEYAKAELARREQLAKNSNLPTLGAAAA